MLLLRHGQSLFNVHFGKTRVDPGIPDPSITDLGLEQALAAAETLKGERIDHLIASPYLRTLQTAEVVARVLDLPIHIDPIVRERCYFHCDIGSPRSTLQERFPHVVFGELEERWWPELDETEDQLDTRVKGFTSAMAARPNWRETLVVTHWGFIRGLTGHEAKNGEIVRHELAPRTPLEPEATKESRAEPSVERSVDRTP